ncbi:hypothetical protein IQ07DRAFT_14022 [Pyrenochaeta sp. DS3sAY3a]|nr:hypothetical protein IQ07DRAFT_14022 [Pyrenochaeta sp. DS3sAY3a]
MTQQKCKNFCTLRSWQAPKAPYKFFGIVAGNECHCGNSYSHTPVPKLDCTTSCSGNPRQACGGTNRMTSWENEDYREPDDNEGHHPRPGRPSRPNHPPQWVGDGVDFPYFPWQAEWRKGANKPSGPVNPPKNDRSAFDPPHGGRPPTGPAKDKNHPPSKYHEGPPPVTSYPKHVAPRDNREAGKGKPKPWLALPSWWWRDN